MKRYTISFYIFILIFFVENVNAQQWHPGDTLNIVEKDTTRIDQFRDNMIDYTGQDLIDASFPNSWPLFGSKARMAAMIGINTKFRMYPYLVMEDPCKVAT